MVFLPLISHAQMHEVGLFLGGSNLIGDVGSRKFINTKAPAFGIIYKYNITTRYSFRGSFSYSKIVNKNFYTNDLNRFRTFLSVTNQITEFSAGVEFNFFDFNLHDQERYLTPYVYLGLNYFRYNLFYIDRNQPLTITEYDKDLEFSIPLTLGMKAKLSPQFVLGFEIGARYALTCILSPRPSTRRCNGNKTQDIHDLNIKYSIRESHFQAYQLRCYRYR